MKYFLVQCLSWAAIVHEVTAQHTLTTHTVPQHTPVQHAQATHSVAPPSVTISNGVIVGTATSVPNVPSSHGLVNSYLGIPFAEKPLRFAPPQPATAWLTPIQATKFKPACIQQYPGFNNSEIQNHVKWIFGSYGGPMPEESEDCLYLNVFTPHTASSTHLKPVMVWIHGGNLEFGTAGLPTYDGGPLAESNDVIVVTFNYRLNIFGFPNSPELPVGAQNAGFLDQRLALQWVQQNIAAFGGDPKKVLLFGESAGGYSVKQLLAHPPKPLPFAAAVMQSQQSGHSYESKSSWEHVVMHFGCWDRISHLRCLREVPAHKLKEFTEMFYVTFGPVQEDGTSTTDIRKSIDAGTFAKVPMMIGTNANEARAFEAFFGMDKSSATIESMAKWFQIANAGNIESYIKQILEQPGEEQYKALDSFLTDLAFTCPSSSIAQYLALKGYDIWRYRYSGVYPNMALFGTHPDQGAYHTAEIAMVFGTSPANSTRPQVELSQLMQGIWSGMAKAPAVGPGWPKVEDRVLAEMGDATGKAKIRTIGWDEIDKDCKSLHALAERMGVAW